MIKSTNQADELLKEFGRAVFDRFDHVLASLRPMLGERDFPSDQAFRSLLALAAENDRPMLIAQYGLEHFMHELMATLEDSEIFHLVAKTPDGDFIDLKQFSESGLHAEQIYWQEEFSTHESISQKIV
ncbi:MULTISPECIES: hypothetical protein [unclassified Mesorhizobium]|uniref:hypothetical protein n=1 Tax=unclassified Mesorhizobium TaxID=325217 RepID=UPI003014A9B3